MRQPSLGFTMAMLLLAAFAWRPAEAQPPARPAAEVLEDVCQAVGCREAALRASSLSAEERLRRVEEAVDRGLPAVYVALDASPDPALSGALDEASALATVRAILRDAPRPPAPGPSTLGIPRKLVPHPHPYLLERSELFPFQQRLILEAQVAPHLFVIDTLTREGVRLHGGNAYAAAITPMFKVRIRNAESSPVQTLSFMPKATLEYFRLPRKQDTEPWGASLWMKGGAFAWGHHSNGQVECLFAAGVPDDPKVCVPPARPRDVHVNYPIGSFSTNYLRFGLFATRFRLDKLEPVAGTRNVFQQVPRSKTTLAATLELNPAGLPPGGSLPEPARALYGPTRVGLLAEHEARLSGGRFFNGSYRGTGSVELIDKTSEAGSSRWRFTAEAAWEPDWFRSGGLLVRYVHGQDYYNLQFTRDIHWLQFGVVFSASEFEPFLSVLPSRP